MVDVVVVVMVVIVVVVMVMLVMSAHGKNNVHSASSVVYPHRDAMGGCTGGLCRGCTGLYLRYCPLTLTCTHTHAHTHTNQAHSKYSRRLDQSERDKHAPSLHRCTGSVSCRAH